MGAAGSADGLGPLSRQQVRDTFQVLMPALGSFLDDVRVVGTASSALRGIDLTVGDIDVLARNRSTVDAIAAAWTADGWASVRAPELLTGDGLDQYFASFDVLGAMIEISTVEGACQPGDLAECVGAAPWIHFDTVMVDDQAIAVVASELRLKSEIIRGRRERWEPIAAHMSETGFNQRLLSAVVNTLPPGLQRLVATAFQETSLA